MAATQASHIGSKNLEIDVSRQLAPANAAKAKICRLTLQHRMEENMRQQQLMCIEPILSNCKFRNSEID